MDPSGSGSWLSRTLFLRDETLMGHDDPIMAASTLRMLLLRAATVHVGGAWCAGGGSEGTAPPDQRQAADRPNRVKPIRSIAVAITPFRRI
jgi:hypothetical protein